jgi:hypothetical protein
MLLFEKTNGYILLIIFNGWILAQISWAFLVSIFIESSLTASVVGYVVAIYMQIMANILGMVVYCMPNHFPWYFHIIPTFSFCRAMQYASI